MVLKRKGTKLNNKSSAREQENFNNLSVSSAKACEFWNPPRELGEKAAFREKATRPGVCKSHSERKSSMYLHI